MLTRKAASVSTAAALALAAFAVPAVNAQDTDDPAGGADSGSISMGSLEGGSLDSGSLAAGSGDEPEGEGRLGSAGSEDSSVENLVPPSEEVCELPDLGGSVAKFYPLFGVSGVPSGVFDLITTALGDFPNLLDMVGGAGSGEALLGDAGSLEGPLCSTILGGQMVMPPVTVIVDGDGNPITTVTGTVAARASTATTTSVSASSGSTVAGDSVTHDDSNPEMLPTSVPTPVAVG